MNRKSCLFFSMCAVAVFSSAVPVVSQAQAVTCQNAEFSREVLERFPNIRNACLQVVIKDGEQRALFKADLTRVYPSKNALKVRFKTQSGDYTPSRYIELPSDFRVAINGRPTRIRDLAIGQELTAQVKVHEPVMTLAEDSPATVAVIFVPIQYDEPAPVERTAAVMPRTGSNLPLLLFWSGLLALAAGAVRIFRLRASSPR